MVLPLAAFGRTGVQRIGIRHLDNECRIGVKGEHPKFLFQPIGSVLAYADPGSAPHHRGCCGASGMTAAG
jgi:hypothetical protein